jgi:hypothetical protein
MHLPQPGTDADRLRRELLDLDGPLLPLLQSRGVGQHGEDRGRRACDPVAALEADQGVTWNVFEISS